MKYTVTKWTIKKLLNTYKTGKLNLSPPYQRNFIWSIPDQQNLIESILKRNPIPNFFILEKKNKEMEMVDGQQRTRTILTFINQQFKDLSGKNYSQQLHVNFLDYEFPVTIITDTDGESIEKFYALVNKTGIHLNKPEVRKADYYNTNILKLVEDITSSSKFKELKIFTLGSLKRMNDVEFISELIVLIEKGHVDKKAHMDDYFKDDLTNEECTAIRLKFNSVLDKIININKVFELSKTRFKQKNDFYTLFDFLLKNASIQLDTLYYFYKLLVLISSDIRPTQEECKPLLEYARNCVTQSNSKAARENRLQFFTDLLLNKGKAPNATQKQILKFYKLAVTDVKKVDSFLLINIIPLNKLKPLEFHEN